MGAFIVYARAFDDSGSMIRPVGRSDGWGVTAEQLENLYRYCEEHGIGRYVWPDCTGVRLSIEEIQQRNSSLEAGLSMLDEEQVQSFTLDSGEKLLSRIKQVLDEGKLILITH